MLSFILLFTIAFALPQLKREEEQETVTCLNKMESFQFFTIEENNQKTFFPLGKCISYDGVNATYDKCNYNYIKVTTCNATGYVDDESTVTYIKLESGIGYSNSLTDEDDQQRNYRHAVKASMKSGIYTLMSKRCITEEGENDEDSIYFKIDQNGTTITKTYYTDNTCSTAKTGDASKETFACGLQTKEGEYDVTYQCPILGIYDENVVNKYNYISSTFNGSTVYSEFGVTLEHVTEDGIYVSIEYFASTETEIIMVNHDYSYSMAERVNITEIGVTYLEELPEHIGYIHVLYKDSYGDYEPTMWKQLFTNECKLFNGINSKFTVEGEKIIITKYEGNGCENVKETEELECGDVSKDGYYRFYCGKYDIKCDPNFGREYKYVKLNLEGQGFIYLPIGECSNTFGDSVNAIPCSSSHVIIKMCDEKGNGLEYGIQKPELGSYGASYEMGIDSYVIKMELYESLNCQNASIYSLLMESTKMRQEDQIGKYVQDGTNIFVLFYDPISEKNIGKKQIGSCGCANGAPFKYSCNSTDICDSNISEKHYKYLTKTMNGKTVAMSFGKCVEYDETLVKFEACSETHVQMITCDENGYIEYISLLYNRMEYKTELPTSIVKVTEYSDSENEETGKYIIMTDGCIEDEGKYYKVSHNGGTITFNYYSDSECKNVAGESETMGCGIYVNGFKYECIEEAVTCDATVGTDYKYALIGEEEFAVMELYQCFEISGGNGQKVKVQYVPCSSSRIEMKPCEGETGVSKKISFENIKYATELPAHIAYSYTYEDDKCEKEELKMMQILKNTCVKNDEDNKYYKFIIDGNRIIEKKFTDKDCKTSEGESTIECDKCISEGEGEDKMYMKYVCSEYGKENGTMGTILLLVLTLIFFLI